MACEGASIAKLAHERGTSVVGKDRKHRCRSEGRGIDGAGCGTFAAVPRGPGQLQIAG